MITPEDENYSIREPIAVRISPHEYLLIHPDDWSLRLKCAEQLKFQFLLGRNIYIR